MQHFILKYFDDLNIQELYDLLQLREAVFQIEQNCVYPDLDDKDKKCFHLLVYKDAELAAYARLVPEGISYDKYVSIGRVLSALKYRKEGFGRLLMQEAMQQMQLLFPNQVIKISAQAYLQKFYESFGFTRVSDEYMEDNIPHIAMVFSQ